MTQALRNLTGQHPEQAADETFVGNTTVETFDASQWHSKRRGNQAFLKNGQPADASLRPVFVKTSEVHAAGLRTRDGQVCTEAFDAFLNELGVETA